MTCICNPPFLHGIHIKILDKAFQISNKIVFLGPINWLESPFFFINKNDGGKTRKYKSLLPHLKNIKMLNLNMVNNLFNIGLRSNIGITIWDRGLYKTFENTFYSKIYKILNDGQRTIFDYIKTQKKTLSYLFIRRQMFDINDFNTKDFFEFDDKFFDKDIRAFCPIYFNTKKEMQNFIGSFNTCFMRYWISKTRPSQFVSIQLLPYMGYEKPWTDERFYKYFDLTADEIKIIESQL